MLNGTGPGMRSALSRLALAMVAVVAIFGAGCDSDTPTAPASLNDGAQTPDIRRVAIDDTLGAVGGIVFDDANQDGVKDESETGIMAVNVVLADPTGKTVSAKTDEAGNYLFDDLEPAFYIVSVDVPEGYTLTTQTNVQVKVNAAEMAMVDHGLYMEETGGDVGSVMGTVYDDANQNGAMDEGEMGLEGLTVGLIDGAGATSDAMTDVDGKYSFADLMPGDYTVVAPMVEGWTLTTPDSVAVTVVAEMAETVDLGLYMEETGGDVGSVSGKVFDDANGNGMMDDGEIGLEGLTVGLVDSAGKSTGAKTDADGMYTFMDLIPGDYTVVGPMVEGWTLTTADSVMVKVSSDMPVMVDFGLMMDEAPSDFLTIGGTVFEDLNHNGIQDEGEAGMGGVKVRLSSRNNPRNVDTKSGCGIHRYTMTDENGDYSFEEVRPGKWRVSVKKAEGYHVTTERKVDVQGDAGDVFDDVDFGIAANDDDCDDDDDEDDDDDDCEDDDDEDDEEDDD